MFEHNFAIYWGLGHKDEVALLANLVKSCFRSDLNSKSSKVC